MNKKQKQNLFKGLLLTVAGFLLWVVVFFNITITEATGDFVVKNHEWTTKLVTNLTENHIFYLIAVGVLFVGYLLITKKKR